MLLYPTNDSWNTSRKIKILISSVQGLIIFYRLYALDRVMVGYRLAARIKAMERRVRIPVEFITLNYTLGKGVFC